MIGFDSSPPRPRTGYTPPPCPTSRFTDAAAAGDPKAAAELLPLVYDELRKLAARGWPRSGRARPSRQRLWSTRHSPPGGSDASSQWNSRGHFFAAAAAALRRILVEAARRKQCHKHGGGRRRIDLDESVAGTTAPSEQLLDFDEVLTRLQTVDPLAARLVELRFFAGLTMGQAADVLGMSLRTAERNWLFARTWLHRELSERPPDEKAG